jgi:hypothetical protein
MKENPNKALHRTAHKAPPVTADVGRTNSPFLISTGTLRHSPLYFVKRAMVVSRGYSYRLKKRSPSMNHVRGKLRSLP